MLLFAVMISTLRVKRKKDEDPLSRTSGAARTEVFVRKSRQTLEKRMPSKRSPSKLRVTLKGKNLPPEGANSFL